MGNGWKAADRRLNRQMDTQEYQVGCNLEYQVATPSVFIFNVEVSKTAGVTISREKLSLPGQTAAEHFIQGETGNRFARVQVQPGTFSLAYEAVVERPVFEANDSNAREVAVENLPPETLPFLFPSRFCQSDKLMRLANAHFGKLAPGFGRVAAICDWIHDNIEYQRGSTNATTSAFDTVTERAGVCRDFAHLGIAFCRALNIPARFVTGYAHQLQPPDFHAYFEAYLGGQWRAFDATRLVPREGLIRIGAGADASQASFASIFGGAQMSGMTVFAEAAQPEALSALD